MDVEAKTQARRAPNAFPLTEEEGELRSRPPDFSRELPLRLDLPLLCLDDPFHERTSLVDCREPLLMEQRLLLVLVI